MRIYLDDDSTSHALQHQLIKVGHDITLPSSVGLAGHADPEHLVYAINNQLALMTGNYDDYNQLHLLIQASGGHHSGILIIRQDNDPRDMKPYHVVTALTKLQAVHTTCIDQYLILNHWR